MAHRHALAWGMVLAAFAVGCGDDGGADDDATPAIDAATADAPSATSDAGGAVLPEQLPDPLPAGPVDVKVATYNIGLVSLLNYNLERKPLGVQALQELGVDDGVEVLCLQEVFYEFTSPAEYASLLSDVFPYSYWSPTGETDYGNGLLIASKHPLYRGREIWFQGDGGAVDRLALAVDVVTDDSYFHFGCTHLEAFSVDITNEEIDRLEEWVTDELGYGDDPFIFIGDFNTGPNTGCCVEQAEPPAVCEEKPMCDGMPCEECEWVYDESPFENLRTFWSDAVEGRPEAAACTFCQEFVLPLQLLRPAYLSQDHRPDHCMYRNLDGSGVLDTEIVLTELFTYEAAGQERTTQASDHRGLACTFGASD